MSYSPLHAMTSNDEKREYGSSPNTTIYNYIELPLVSKQDLRDVNRKEVTEDDYLFFSENGDLENAKLFGQVKNYSYSFTGSGGGYTTIYWKEARDEDGNVIENILNVPTKPRLPYFLDVGEKENPIKFFVERPKQDESNKTCIGRFCKFLSGSGTKRRKKNKKRKSKKQRKTKKRRKQ
jgi:hypothetical protein